ncbi:hypothetical protein PAXINDRAFT_90891 [Paxillus involutus ATCC 200175]|uniref:Uncharacterized protein n=1 Tax=Paxillus involutus ATCC 200175 TaxID=664439 RepID=A0A0C9TIM6_PAXIN|nr:hypothetical protein PAXINDRAFT_90891 [Paxillus involutus ATCC 200175]
MLAREVKTKVKINRQTILDVLYIYSPGTVVEYPATSGDSGHIGHLFEMDPTQEWSNPCNSFAYSLGPPKGSRGHGGDVLYCDLLTDTGGQRVPCRESHATCSKACSYADEEALSAPHFQASRDAVQSSLLALRKTLSPDAQLLQRTMSYWAALCRAGCSAPPDPCQMNLEIIRTPRKQAWLETWDKQRDESHRGQPSKLTCKGQLIFDHGHDNQPIVRYVGYYYYFSVLKFGHCARCEFYSKNGPGARDHFLDHGPSSGLYDIDYLQALFNGDTTEIAMIEQEAMQKGFDLSAPCRVVMNHTSVRSKCPHTHRNANGELVLAPMKRLYCQCLFRVYQPFEEYRTTCPRILVVCSKPHNHPVPLPAKTPTSIWSDLFRILEEMDHDLPDMTPCRFLRHPTVLTFLRRQSPDSPHPTLANLHVSLANRDHLWSYITQVQKLKFPFGTGWQGL